jgi:hypothetical protein
MIRLPYALLDRICDLARHLAEQPEGEARIETVCELLRACPDGRQVGAHRAMLTLLLDAEEKAMWDILADTWLFVAPPTSGAEIAAALAGAAAQSRRTRTVSS